MLYIAAPVKNFQKHHPTSTYSTKNSAQLLKIGEIHPDLEDSPYHRASALMKNWPSPWLFYNNVNNSILGKLIW